MQFENTKKKQIRKVLAMDQCNQRTFFFLKDKKSGLFYTGEDNEISDFPNAAVYYSVLSAKKRIKDIIIVWEHYQQWIPIWQNQGSAQNQDWAKEKLKQIKLREKLPQWGIITCWKIIKYEI